MTRKLLAVVTICVRAALAGYTYELTDPLTSNITSHWYQPESGTLSFTSNGLTSSADGGGSLIWNGSFQSNPSFYEVKMKLKLASSGGVYISYLRASNDAKSGPGLTGTFYSVEISNPTFTSSGCSATMLFIKSVNAQFTVLGSLPVPCHDGMEVRSVYTANGNGIDAFIDNVWYGQVFDSEITAAGHPGVGVRGSPANNYVQSVSFGHIDTAVPNTINTQMIGTSSFATSPTGAEVDFQWQPPDDDANGTGVAFYHVLRNGSWVDMFHAPEFSDRTLNAGQTYNYTIIAVDYHFNTSATPVTIVTAPSYAIDPRSVGQRATGSYWGGGGEQIDMRSGNLNYTIPLLKAQGRGGWGVGFNLSYNSQNWRLDMGGTWMLGRDEGYGFGWKLLAGSLTPYYSNYWVLHHFIFTDATGAEYRLDVQNDQLWTTSDAVHIWYDNSTGLIHFPDGSFWKMGCVSAGTEQDAGTMYPTLMQDTNGNQILIRYYAGMSITWSDSSSRIWQIEDVRANLNVPPNYSTYNFEYEASGGPLVPPHLKEITNTIGTSEHYTFTYPANPLPLQSPFSGTSYGSWKFLQAADQVLAGGVHLSTGFTYDTVTNSGELTQVTLPYYRASDPGKGGYLKWTYSSVGYSPWTQREVVQRNLPKTGGESIYTITRSAPSYVHGSATLVDNDGKAKKTWLFQTDTTRFDAALVTSYQEFDMPSGTLRSQNDYTWTQSVPGNHPFISQVITTMDGVSKKVTQQVDQYGNLTEMKVYNWGTGTLARTYTNTYLTDDDCSLGHHPCGLNATYASLYIFNRLLSSTVTDGVKSATLANNTYDQGGALAFLGNFREHDPNISTTWMPRGNVRTSVSPGSNVTFSYDSGGNAVTVTKNGVTGNVTMDTTKNAAVPSAITANSQTTSLSWSSFLGLASEAGPNGDTMSIGYNATDGRPSTSTSPFGAATTYTYADTATPPTRTSTISGRWTKTTLDGFGRATQIESGDTQTQSRVEIQYAACGCSPLGKMSKKSQPYVPSPNATVYWTTYDYDGLGRTTQVTAPDGSVTKYTYQANTVTVFDPAYNSNNNNNSKKYTSDAFGNLTKVEETDPTLGAVTTSYTYDVLNHLTNVSMPRNGVTQTRTFDYTGGGNSVGALLRSATNPETNNLAVAYTYNANNQLATKTDANGNQFVYSYDTSGRPTQITANGNTLRTFYYDTNPFDSSLNANAAGRLTAIQYAAYNVITTSGTTPYTFIEMFGYQQAPAMTKRRLRLQEVVTYPTGTYPPYAQATIHGDLDTNYTYDNEGRVLNTAYPATQFSTSPTYTNQFDGMGRLSGMKDQFLNQIVGGVTYGPANEMLTFNNETRTYNKLFQLKTLTQGTRTITYTFPDGTNNGKITSQTYSDTGEIVQYTYDPLNRLATTTGTSPVAWGQTFVYDGFGNLTNRIPSGGAPSSPGTPADPLTNRLTGYTYDNNGNLLSIGNIYDAENRLISVLSGTVQYFYDSDNKRIWVGNFSSGQLTSEQVFFYGLNGKKLGAYTPNITYSGQIPQSIEFNRDFAATTNAYFGSRLLNQGAAAFVPDRLESSGRYFPYGEERNYPALPNDQVKFATYTRDNVTGLDYADHRYYSPSLARFINPDPYAGSPGPPVPQSWNRYRYALGDPVNNNDPSGLDPIGVINCKFNGEEVYQLGCLMNFLPLLVPLPRHYMTIADYDDFHGIPTIWEKALAKLSNANNLLQNLNASKDCLADLDSISGGRGAFLLSAVQTIANITNWNNGYTSTEHERDLYPSGTRAYNMTSATRTIGQALRAGGTAAESALPGSALTGNIYFDPAYVSNHSVGFDAALLMHENMHSLGLIDSQLMGGLGFDPDDLSVKATKKLAQDCFGVTGAEVKF